MPNRTVTLTQIEAVRIHGLVHRMVEGSKGERLHRTVFMDRLMAAYPESDPKKGMGPCNPETRRGVLFTAEEQRAVANGIVSLAGLLEWDFYGPEGQIMRAKVTAGHIANLLEDARLLGLKTYVVHYLSQDKVEPFDGAADEEPVLADAAEAAPKP